MTATATKLPVVILISGTGSNMLRLATLAQSGELAIEVKAVISDRADAKGLSSAAQLGIATATLNPKQFSERSEFDKALAELVSSFNPQLVILAGFMRILSGNFIQHFRDQLLNIHPSLLPKYRGLHTHRRALEAGDLEHGASVHVVTEELDGGPLIIQARVPVLQGDDEATLSARVLQQEHQIFPRAVELFATGRLTCRNNLLLLDGQELQQPLQVLNNSR
ncbi:MAG: phosphoribosylglycinamide formyltransferase [Steroidobacteraceae bacterium]